MNVKGRRLLLALAITALSVPLPSAAAGEPTDAASFSQRGTALAARGDFVHAIADLTRACELAPSEPRYFYERAMARWANGQPVAALQDLDQTLKLKPDDVPALISRAELRLVFHDNGAMVADLDLAAQSAAKQSQVRMTIGDLYTRGGRFESAIAQYDLWIAAHPQSAQMPAALKARCWARALAGKSLEKALSDCNAALGLKPDTPGALDSRGLVELRLGRFDQSIEDYDAALRSQPRNAWLLYARGIAELRSGRRAEGQADLGAASGLQPQIADVGRQRGLVP